MDLYDKALAECIRMLTRLYEVLAGQTSPDGLGAFLGNESLDTGREQCIPVHSHPFPLPRILQEIYQKMEDEQ